MNKLMQYFTQRRLARINNKIGVLQGELTYYKLVEEELENRRIRRFFCFMREADLSDKLEGLYAIQKKLRTSLLSN